MQQENNDAKRRLFLPYRKFAKASVVGYDDTSGSGRQCQSSIIGIAATQI